jgi:hypothetical protein
MNYCGKKETQIPSGEARVCGQPPATGDLRHVCDACKLSEMRMVLQVLIDADEWSLMEDGDLWERARRVVEL